MGKFNEPMFFGTAMESSLEAHCAHIEIPRVTDVAMEGPRSDNFSAIITEEGVAIFSHGLFIHDWGFCLPVLPNGLGPGALGWKLCQQLCGRGSRGWILGAARIHHISIILGNSLGEMRKSDDIDTRLVCTVVRVELLS